ncbi:MAG: MFS transporter [Sphingomonas sp.]
MGNPYRAIFQPPGAKGFAAAGFFARLPVAMAPIGIVTMLSQTHGGYWLGGAVAATFTLTNAMAAPQMSRMTDRLGQSNILIPTTSISVASFILLMLSAHRHWPTWTLFLAALLAASMPSMAAMVRARWSALFTDRPELGTAFAFESAADELVYIAGASVSVSLSVALFPEAGLVASTLLLALGTGAFVLQRRTEPRVRHDEHGPKRAAIFLRPVQLITLAMVLVGTIFATAEVSTVALARELKRPEAASWIIALYAAGSFVIGILLGALKLRAPLHSQLIVCIAALLITTVPLLLADSVPLLAGAIFLSGIAVSPTFITAFGLIEQHVPRSALTEGITWVGTGIGIGLAFGAFVSGWVVDTLGPRNGFWVSITAAAFALTLVVVGQPWLRKASPESPVQA